MAQPDVSRSAVNVALTRAHLTWLGSEDAPSFLADTGWTIQRLLTTPDLDREHLGGTQYAGTMTSGLSYIVTATNGAQDVTG